MPYEVSLYRHRILDDFNQWEEKYRDDPLREDAYIRATRMKDILSAVLPTEDDSPVPGDSVLREFIGGSRYSY